MADPKGYQVKNNLQVEVDSSRKQKNDENIKIIEKLERDLQSEKNVMKVWRNRLIARILRISAHEDLECLTKLGPEELFSKDEEVMSQVRPLK